jgi:hypothetical protein
MTRSTTSHRSAWLGIAALIVTAACARFLPHLPANFSPVGAMGLYAGAMLPWPMALLVSLSGLFLSDLVLGLYHPVAMLFVYSATALNVLAGYRLCHGQRNLTKLLAATLLGAILFFAVSNFGVWLAGELYPRNAAGLLDCYVAALPFFGNTLASQALFALVLFSLHNLLRLTFARESCKTP